MLAISDCDCFSSSRVGSEVASLPQRSCCCALIVFLFHTIFYFFFFIIIYLLFVPRCIANCCCRCGNHKKLDDPDGHRAAVIAIILDARLCGFWLAFGYSCIISVVAGRRGQWPPPTRRRAIKSNLLTVTHKNGHTKRREATKQAQPNKQTKQATEPS